MLNKLLSYLTLGGVVALIVLQLIGSGQVFGGTTNYDSLALSETLSVTGAATLSSTLAVTGATTLSATTTVGGLQVDSGTTIQEYSCATATWDPPAFSSTTVASTSIALAGVALGDVVIASFDSATSTVQWYATANIGPAGSSTAYLVAVPSTISADAYNTALNITTSTLRVCYVGH